jgi:hypothetical protein
MPFLSLSMQSQIHEVGVFLESNFVWWLGPTAYVAPNDQLVYSINGIKSEAFVAGILYAVYNHIKWCRL